MSYQNPISNEVSRPDTGLDMALNSLVRDFMGLVWLDEKVFYRAYEIKQEVHGEMRTEPQVYMGGSEYYPVLYNDHLSQSLFFVTDGDETISFDKVTNPRVLVYSRPMSLIFWGVMTRIDTTYASDYIFGEGIKTDFMTILGKNQYVRTITRYIDDPLDEVFKGYSIAEEKRHLSRHPNIALRINFTVEYKTGLTPC